MIHRYAASRLIGINTLIIHLSHLDPSSKYITLFYYLSYCLCLLLFDFDLSDNMPPRAKNLKRKAGADPAIESPAAEAGPSNSVVWNAINGPGR
jgi:hypothetical protein